MASTTTPGDVPVRAPRAAPRRAANRPAALPARPPRTEAARRAAAPLYEETKALLASLEGGCHDEEKLVSWETRLTDFEAEMGNDCAWSRASFEKWCTYGKECHVQTGNATIIWRRNGHRWHAERWHLSLGPPATPTNPTGLERL